ncbi:MAG: class I SAM-dependent methyltransferase [Phycisphaerae bacterium]
MSKKASSTGLDPVRAKAQARRQFDAWAGTYDRSVLHHFLFGPSYVVLAEEIGRWYRERLPESFRVLDVGCGTGTLAYLVARAGWPVSVVGLDYAPAMCAQAAGKAGSGDLARRIRFTAGDSEHLPFADGSFDVVTCSNSFHHYPHQQTVVSEMRRLLRPGGRLILVDGFRDNVVGWVVFDVIIGHVEKDVYHAPWPVIQGYFETAGLADIRRRKFNLIFPLLATIGDAPTG